MRKPLVGALAAVTFGGAVAASATPASADSWRRHRDRDNDAAAAAIVAGVAGLAIGAALAGNSRDRGYYNRGYYQDPYYGRGYYGSGYRAPYAYAPAYGYRTCTMKERVRDPYTGRRMTITRRYAC